MVESPLEVTLWQQLTNLKRGVNVVRVPVPPAALNMALLHVVAVRAVGTTPSRAPYFYHENKLLLVTDSARVLRVRVTPERSRYQPRDTVRVSIDVRDRAGAAQRAEVALWAVDEGVVSLTGYAAPKLGEQLRRRPYEYWWVTSTLLGTLMPGPPGLGPLFSRWALYDRAELHAAALTGRVQVNITTASGGRPPAPTLRHRFVTTPFFAGSLVTDADGRVTTSFVLPDNVTTYRLFAAAVDDGVRSGAADTAVITTRPLVVRVALPRIVRTGDTLYAGTVLTREGSGATTPVALTVRADGMHVDGQAVAHDTLVGVGRASAGSPCACMPTTASRSSSRLSRRGTAMRCTHASP